MRVQVVLHQHDFLCPGIADVHQVLDRLCIIHRGAPRCHQHLAPTRQRLEHHEQVPRAMAFVLIVDALRASGCRRERRADILHQLLGPFIKADQRPLRVIRSLIHRQGIFHRTDELGVRLRRNDPLLLQPGLEVIFLSVCRTVSRPMEATSSSSTSLSASRRSVQDARPAGAWLHAMATRRASCAPSSLRGFVRADGWRARAVSSPSSTNRWRNRWMVDTPTSNASVICWSGQFGPSTSAFSSIRARSALSRATRGPATSCWRVWRSSSVNRTVYLASLPMARSFLRFQCGAMYPTMGQTCQTKVDTPLGYGVKGRRSVNACQRISWTTRLGATPRAWAKASMRTRSPCLR